MAHALDVEQTSVGRKANCAQLGKIGNASADTKVARVVDGCLGSKGFPLLVVLLDTRLLVVDIQRGNDALGNEAGTEAAGVRRLILRSKTRLTWLGRPISRFSRITSSKKTRPVTG